MNIGHLYDPKAVTRTGGSNQHLVTENVRNGAGLHEHSRSDGLRSRREGGRMNFLLTGFSSDLGCRVFAFQRIGENNSRTAFAVRADLASLKDFGIRIQELPLLCRRLLEDLDVAEKEHLLTFTREHMRLHAETCAAELSAARMRRTAHRRPFGKAQSAAASPAPQPEERP